MSVQGLVRRPHFEEVLNAAIKDQTSQHGLLSVPMQRAATDMINNPLFQRVQATIGEGLQQQERAHIQEKEFQLNLQKLSVEARVNHDDLKWLVENIQQPPPPPTVVQGPRGG